MLLRRGCAIALLAAACFASVTAIADDTIQFSIDAGKQDRVNTPISVELAVPAAVKDATRVDVRDETGNKLVGQLTSPSLLAKPATAADKQVARELHFILPELKAGQSKSYTATIGTKAESSGKPADQFQWKDTAGEHEDLLFGDRSVMRYMYHKLDESSKAARDETFKPYHHVFDFEGKNLLTKGPGGLYPHHHGIFYGFNKTTFDGGKPVDIWHCTNAFQEHSKFLAHEAGPVLARQLVEITWNSEPKIPDSATTPADAKKAAEGNKKLGDKNEVFAKEQREMTVYNTPGGLMIDFASKLNAELPPVHLDGDPQHAGFHYRSTNEVNEKSKNETFYIRPDGIDPVKGEKGTRNWPAQKEHVNLPWDAMSVVVGGKRYTVAYLDKPTNPKESRFSERDYGRFGSYFVTDLTAKDKPLDVNYRLWIQPGAMDVPDVAGLDTNFVDPPKVTLK
jgi:hypothetical protein